MGDDLLLVPLEWSASRADTERVTRLVQEIDALLEWESEAIAQVVTMLLAERILRAVLANRHDQLADPVGLQIGADALKQGVREVLMRVCTGQVPPNTYRTM